MASRWYGSALVLLFVCTFGMQAAHSDAAVPKQDSARRVSYYTDVRPIFQVRCQGCHQSAKAGGEYVMTTFDRLCRGGESQSAAIVPGRPDDSYLITRITPEDGTAEMPQDGKSLSPREIAVIRSWIAQGAVDDTPDGARPRVDAAHPPVYTHQPVITSMDFSPDGRLLAVAGFHEVFLHKANGSGLVARLVGLSARIESVRFSPDGKRLAVTGGLPARMGEIQIWDIAIPPDRLAKPHPRLQRSIPVTFDTVYGGSWSPDGKLIAFGCSDNSVRAIDARSGKQVLFQGAHMDWVRDTVFSVDGKNLVSVSRDMSVKMTEVATERFIDNITSITPGALKGGVNSVARHPRRDEVVIGGADGVPKVYRMHRITARRIGDDANLIRRLPAMKGRIFSVDISPDGRRIAAGSSLNGVGQVAIYSYEFDPALPDEIKKIMSKVVSQRSAAEKQQLEAYHTRDVRVVARREVPECGIFAVCFRPDGQQVAVAGGDGLVRLVDAKSGEIRGTFPAAPITDSKSALAAPTRGNAKQSPTPAGADGQQTKPVEALAAGAKVKTLEIVPDSVTLTGPFDYVQLLITARLTSGERVDVTRLARKQVSSDAVEISRRGIVHARADGTARLHVECQGQSAEVTIHVAGARGPVHPDFVRDVAPVITRLGCNAGTCHGAAKGKNGFKLSLRGYDPVTDVRAFTDDLASRRANVASPDNSLMLLKATAGVPHGGGRRTAVGSDYYQILRDWIADGARLNADSPKVASIDVFPKNAVLRRPGTLQQIRVVATYTDGRRRDVTTEAFIESGNTEVVTGDNRGLLTAVRRGEAPVLARFEGAYAATTLTVMGDRTGFVWHDPPIWTPIDRLVAEKWRRMKIEPAALCTDADFVRRVYLDLTGLPPTLAETRAFLDDARATRQKRAALIDRLIGNPAYVDYWTNKWADLLQVNRKFLGAEGAAAFRRWIHKQVETNTPYDRFVREILTATGSTLDHPAASYYKILRDPGGTMENTTQLFLAVRFSCNKCHDHPFERWTQDQYYETAAYFARVGRQGDPRSKGKRIGGSAVMAATPLYEIISDQKEGEVVNDRTGKVTAPKFPFPCNYPKPPNATRRAELAAWLTAPENPYFARSYVNRLWGYLTGVGLIEPLDDIRAGNPPTNPALLDYLRDELITSGFNTRHIIRLICHSRTYQLSIVTSRWNEDDQINYAHATARRLPAEVLYDTLHAVTGSKSHFPGVPPGTRAAALPDSGVKLPSNFLATLGRPARESACECERSDDMQLGSVMALVSGPVTGQAIADPDNQLTRLVEQRSDDRDLINTIFLTVLNRPARDAEIRVALDSFDAIDEDHGHLMATLKTREADWAKRLPVLEQNRKEKLVQAKAELAAYQEHIKKQAGQRQNERLDRIKKAESAVAQYATDLPTRLTQWEAKHRSSAEWHLLAARKLAASQGATLRSQSDRSIRAEGKADQGTYTVTVHTHVQGITGFRLEALPVEGLAGGGPGLSPNGNYVLTEIQVKAAPLEDPKKLRDVALQNARADFTQDGFNVAQAIDGVTGDQRGWAIHPAGGTVHWATFETGTPTGFSNGTVLQFVLHQYHNAAAHRLARFRLALTTSPRPLPLGLPDLLQAVSHTPAKDRSEKQRKQLSEYYRKVDTKLRDLQSALAEAKKPLAIDPGLRQRQAVVKALEKPVPLDTRLARLRADVKTSADQLRQRRLTAAQDLVWALVNSPAFLFNH